MSLHPAVAAVRLGVRRDLADLARGARPCSSPARGGADSLALLAATVFEARRRGLRVVGATVDHGLQDGSAAHAARRRRRRWPRSAWTRPMAARVRVDGAGLRPGGGRPRGAVRRPGADRRAVRRRRGPARPHPRRPGRDGAAGPGPRLAAAARSPGCGAAFDRYRRPLLDVRPRGHRGGLPAPRGSTSGTTRTTTTRGSPRCGCAHGVLPLLEARARPGVAADPGPHRRPAARRHGAARRPRGGVRRWRRPTALRGRDPGRPTGRRPPPGAAAGRAGRGPAPCASCSTSTCSRSTRCSPTGTGRGGWTCPVTCGPCSGTARSSSSHAPAWLPRPPDPGPRWRPAPGAESAARLCAMDAAHVENDLVNVLFTEERSRPGSREMAQQIERRLRGQGPPDGRHPPRRGHGDGGPGPRACPARRDGLDGGLSYGSGTKSSGVVRILKDLDTDITRPARPDRRRDHRHRPHPVLADLQPELAQPGQRRDLHPAAQARGAADAGRASSTSAGTSPTSSWSATASTTRRSTATCATSAPWRRTSTPERPRSTAPGCGRRRRRVPSVSQTSRPAAPAPSGGSDSKEACEAHIQGSLAVDRPRGGRRAPGPAVPRAQRWLRRGHDLGDELRSSTRARSRRSPSSTATRRSRRPSTTTCAPADKVMAYWVTNTSSTA